MDERRPCRRRESGGGKYPPSRRLTARELVLPWAHLSVPVHWHRVNQATFAVGTPCCCWCLLKDCERWFLPPWPQARYCSPTCQEAAQHWRSWHAGQTYRATIQGKERRREQARRHRERAQQRSGLAEPASPTPLSEPALPAIEAQTTSDSIPIIPAGNQSVGQRPAEILPKSCGLPCSRPGCYVLFLPSPRSPDQHFCSGSCRLALRRVRQRETRLRRR